MCARLPFCDNTVTQIGYGRAKLYPLSNAEECQDSRCSLKLHFAALAFSSCQFTSKSLKKAIYASAFLEHFGTVNKLYVNTPIATFPAQMQLYNGEWTDRIDHILQGSGLRIQAHCRCVMSWTVDESKVAAVVGERQVEEGFRVLAESRK
jgi:hypothetical protein